MGAAIRLHWICHHPTPYLLHLFRALQATGAIDLEVHFRVPLLASHPWESLSLDGIRSRYYDPILGVDLPLLRLAARDEPSLFVITGWNEPTMQLVASVRARSGRPFALLTDTPDLASRRNSQHVLAVSIRHRHVRHRCAGVVEHGHASAFDRLLVERMEHDAVELERSHALLGVGAVDRLASQTTGALDRGALARHVAARLALDRAGGIELRLLAAEKQRDHRRACMCPCAPHVEKP